MRPPTPAPTEPLPATPLPDSVKVDAANTGGEDPVTASAESEPLSPTGSSMVPFLFIGILAVLAIGIVWYLWHRKGLKHMV